MVRYYQNRNCNFLIKAEYYLFHFSIKNYSHENLILFQKFKMNNYLQLFNFKMKLI